MTILCLSVLMIRLSGSTSSIFFFVVPLPLTTFPPIVLPPPRNASKPAEGVEAPEASREAEGSVEEEAFGWGAEVEAEALGVLRPEPLASTDWVPEVSIFILDAIVAGGARGTGAGST